LVLLLVSTVVAHEITHSSALVVRPRALRVRAGGSIRTRAHTVHVA
jgi:hypothetical protein